MPTDGKRATVLDLLERVVVIEGKTSAAHQRIDKMESGIREDLDEIKAGLKEMSQELKDVIGWMNRGKGWAAAAILIAGAVGGVVSKVIFKLAG